MSTISPTQGYDDGYDGQYDDDSYDTHDDSYSNPSKRYTEVKPPCLFENLKK